MRSKWTNLKIAIVLITSALKLREREKERLVEIDQVWDILNLRYD